METESQAFGMPTLRFTADVDAQGLMFLLFCSENSPEISLSQSRRSWEKGGVGIAGRDPSTL